MEAYPQMSSEQEMLTSARKGVYGPSNWTEVPNSPKMKQTSKMDHG